MMEMDRKEYKLVWEDDFAYEGVPDPAKWNYDLGNRQWANQELQADTDRTGNVSVRGGKLVIRALKERDGERQYTSARVLTLRFSAPGAGFIRKVPVDKFFRGASASG